MARKRKTARRGRVSRRVARKGRRVKKKGYNRLTLPRSFPPSEMHQPFTSIQSKLINGHVNNLSHWQVFRFESRLDGSHDFGTHSDIANNNQQLGARIATHSYRNWDLLSPFYDRMYCDGCWLTLEFQSQKAMTDINLCDFNIYVWMTCNDAAAQDNTQPVDMSAYIGNATAGLPAAFIDNAQTTATIAKLEQSRRVTVYRSRRVNNTSYATIKVWIPNYSTRRGQRLAVSKKAHAIGDGGNAQPPSRTVATALALHYGFHNQVNVAVIAENSDTTETSASKYMNFLRVTKTFKANFYDRKETTS